MIRPLLLCVALLVPAAASCADSPVAQRVRYWRVELPRAVPVGSTASALVSWLGARHMRYEREQGSGFINIELEKVPGDGIACKSWSVVATASLDNAGEVIAYDVDSSGACNAN